MYTQFFRLKQAPFSIAPDPRYLFMSERHREALAHLLYGVNSGGGFVLLTGEIGAGKTTVCRCFLEQIPANCNVAYIFNPKLSVTELLKSICDEFGIRSTHDGPAAATVKDYVDALNGNLLTTHAEDKNNVLIIDEAQNLSAEVLEQLRLLTNLETSERKLLQIILIGQPELRAMLAKPELKQLAQRVIARYHLDSLSAQETTRYILHRLAIAGLTAAPPFQAKLMQQIHHITRGVPRRINLLCDRALLGAYAENKFNVDRGIVRKAASEVFGKDAVSAAPGAQSRPYLVLGLMGLMGLIISAAIVAATAWTVAGNSANTAVANTPLKSAVAALKPATSNAAEPMQKSSMPATPSTSDAPSEKSPAVTTSALSEPGASTRDEALAYRQLAQLWDVALPDGEACKAAAKKDLRCYRSDGGLAELRQLDRPAILTLRDNADKTYYGLLISLTNSSATLRIGDTTETVSLLALGRRFHGEFISFWRSSQSYREYLESGDRGADVDWLAVQLAKTNGMKPPPTDQPFDQTMARQVREFQAAQGLAADGVVSPKTFMNLNSATGVKEPYLLNNPAFANASAGK